MEKNKTAYPTTASPASEASALLENLSTHRNSVSESEFKRLDNEVGFAIAGSRKSSIALERLSLSLSSNANSMKSILGAFPSNEKLIAEIQNEQSHVFEHTWNLDKACCLAMLSTFNFGYNSGVINSPKDVIFPDKTEFQWSLVVSIFCIGGLIGAYLGGMLANYTGRKGAIVGSSIFYVVSSLLQVIAPNIQTLIFARFLLGITAGASTVFTTLYIGELSPPNLRGELGSWNQFMMVAGIFVADLNAFPLCSEDGWRLLLGFAAIPSMIQLLFVTFFVESPRFLIMNENYNEAELILQQLRDTQDVKFELKSIISAKQKGKGASNSQSGGSILQEVRDNKSVRFSLIVAVVLHLAQQFCGINAVFYYSTSFFASMGLSDPLFGTSLVGFINMLATVVAIKLMDMYGRKPLLMLSIGGMIASTIVIIICMFVKDSLSETSFGLNITTLVAMMSYVSFFEFGMGPVVWLIAAEIFPVRVRAGAMGVAVFFNWTANFLVGISYPFCVSMLGNFSWFPFLVVLLVVFFFTLTTVIETKDKTLEEIQAEISVHVQPKEMKNWETYSYYNSAVDDDTHHPNIVVESVEFA